MSSRDPWFDNAKMALVTLVVVGHSLVMIKAASPLADHLYDFLYAWHMPAFVLVTGYLSRNFRYSRARLWSLVRGLVVPYILIEGALAVFRHLAGGEDFHNLWLVPHWPMWFLPALFFWRLLTPPLRRLGPAAVAVAIGLSLVGGFLDIDYLDLRRILGFLPFYAIGLCLTPGTLEHLRSTRARVAAVAALVGTWFATGLTDRVAETHWFLYSYTYAHLETHGHPVLLIRAGVLALGVLAAFSALALVPRTGGWFTRMGAASLVVYLCHGFVVKAVGYSPYDDWAQAHTAVGLPLTIAGAAAVALLLASTWVAGRLQKAIDPLSYAEGELDRAVELHVIADELVGPEPAREEERPLATAGAAG